MKKILILTLLLGFGFGVQPSSFGQSAAPPPAQNAPAVSKPGSTRALRQAQRQKNRQQQAAVRKQKKRAELATKFGMTLAQIQQYEALQAARVKKVAEIKKIPGLSQQDIRKRIYAETKEFTASMNKILTPAQLELITKERKNSTAQAAQVRPMLQRYRKELSALRTLRATQPDNYKKEVAQLKKNYETNISVVVGKEKAHRLLYREGGKRNARSNGARRYHLSYADARQYKRLETIDKRRRDRLARINLTRKDRDKKVKQLDARRDAEFKALLGEEKFKQWQRDQHPTFDQQLKKSGLSDRQIAQYKDILNKQAIARFKTGKGKGSKEEKRQIIEQLQTETDQKLRQIMTPEQYSKIMGKKQQNKESARRKAINAHTVKPVPKARQSTQPQPTK